MLHTFLANNRDELIVRCRSKGSYTTLDVSSAATLASLLRRDQPLLPGVGTGSTSYIAAITVTFFWSWWPDSAGQFWSGGNDSGTPITAAPAIATEERGGLEVFYRGANGHLFWATPPIEALTSAHILLRDPPLFSMVRTNAMCSTAAIKAICFGAGGRWNLLPLHQSCQI